MPRASQNFLFAKSGIEGPFKVTQVCYELIQSFQSHHFCEQRKKSLRNGEWTLNNCNAEIENDSGTCIMFWSDQVCANAGCLQRQLWCSEY